MSNTDFDLDAEPPVDFTSRRAQAVVASSVDAEPDKAARAQQIAQTGGFNPGAVYENLEQYEDQTKNSLSSAIVGKNPALQAYVNDHPLAAKVSNDDYGQLDAVSNAVNLLGTPEGLGSAGDGTVGKSIIQAGIQGFQETSGLEGLSDEHAKLAAQLASNPVFANIFVRQAALAGATAFTGSMDVASGLIGAAGAGIGEAYHQAGGSEADAAKLARDLIVFAQVGLSGQAGLHGVVHPEVHAMINEAAQVAKAVAPYVEAGKESPVGLHPVIDEFKADQAKTDADNLSSALKESAKSATRERSPDLFASYISKITDGEIGIKADAVRELYGDKLPTSDDGVLGWVPRLREQLEAAEATGGDVKVPLADWLAWVEPDVAKELQDHIRVRPEGMTVEEAKELPPQLNIGPTSLRTSSIGKDLWHETSSDSAAAIIQDDLSNNVSKARAANLFMTDNPDLAIGQRGNGVKIQFNGSLVSGAEHKKPGTGDLTGREYQTNALGNGAIKSIDVAPGVQLPFKGAWKDKFEREFISQTLEDGTVRWTKPRDETVDNLRQAAGLQGIQERKLSLERGQDVGAAHVFTLRDATGADTGELYIAEENEGKRLYVDDIRSRSGPQSLGPGAMRDVIEQLKEQFPNAETLEGQRVSGARQGLDTKASIDLTKIKSRAKAPEPEAPGLLQRVKEAVVGKSDEQVAAEAKALDEREAFDKAAAIGMTVDQYKRYQRLIERRAAEDTEKSSARAMADQRKRQTEEWKANRAELRPQVKAEIEGRPEAELDEMLREGKVKLNPEGLTDDQKALLPKDYLSANGIHTDDLAGLFGDTDSRALVDRVVGLNQSREGAGMKPGPHLQRMIDAETDRRMEARYGNLDKNILEEAKDQVLSETQEDLLHEETLARANEAGLEYSIRKDELKAAIKGFFDRQLVRDVSSDVSLAEAGRAGRATEMALLKGDYAVAFRQKQRQYHAVVMANYARRFEKEQARFDRLATRYKARELPAVDQEYTNWIRDILLRTGKLDPRAAQDLSMLIDHSDSGIKGLQEFVDYKEHHDLRELPVAEYLADPNFRSKYEDLSTADAHDLHDSVRALDKNGRDEKKYIRAGEAHDLNELKANLVESLQRFQEIKYDTEGARAQVGSGVRGAIRTAIVAHLQVETVFNRLDRFDAKGPWNQFVFRPLVEAANHEAKLEKEFSKKLGAIADNASLKEVIPNSPFKNPFSGEPMQMTRKNLRAVLLNAGNDSSLFKMTAGYQIGEIGPKGKFVPNTAAVKDWLNEHATKADWDWGQRVWDMMKELGERSDTMYRGLTGVAPEKLQIKGVDTPHGRYEGGYYPLIRHELYGEDVKLAKNDLEGAGYIRATTAAGYTKKRTGATYPLSLDLDSLPNSMRQIIHDTSYRPAIIEAGKIFYDNKIKNEFKKHLGAEYADMFVPWLKDVANAQNFASGSKATKMFSQFSDFMRQNAITTLVGLNPSTVMKHTPTALMSSMAEVGPKQFLKAVQGLLTVNEETGNNNWQFAMKTSEELQRRARNWVETMGGGMRLLEGEQGSFMHLRDVITEVASKPVAMGDLISAVPTWMAKYAAEMEDHGVHGDAVYAADKSVRQAHGSSAVTSKSQVARAKSLSWFTGFFTFFNDLFNRQVETLWKAGEALDLAKDSRHGEAMKLGTEVAGRLFAYVIAPAMIEEMVTPLSNDQHESWGKKAAKGLTFTLSSSYVFVREIVNAMLNGRDPAAGLLTTSYKSLTDMSRDLSSVKPKPGNVIKHGATLAGMLTGMVPAQVGRTAEFMAGKEKPKGPWGWLVGARYGTLQNHSQTFNQYMKGR